MFDLFVLIKTRKKNFLRKNNFQMYNCQNWRTALRHTNGSAVCLSQTTCVSQLSVNEIRWHTQYFLNDSFSCFSTIKTSKAKIYGLVTQALQQTIVVSLTTLKQLGQKERVRWNCNCMESCRAFVPLACRFSVNFPNCPHKAWLLWHVGTLHKNVSDDGACI